jgi:hypothetical protein
MERKASWSGGTNRALGRIGRWDESGAGADRLLGNASCVESDPVRRRGTIVANALGGGPELGGWLRQFVEKPHDDLTVYLLEQRVLFN